MRKLPIFVLSLLLVPAIAFAQSAEPPPPPPDDAQKVETTRPPDAEPDVRPPAPPAAPPSRAQDDDQVGILQQRAGDAVGVLQGPSDDAYRDQPPPAGPRAAAPSGQWVRTNQYGWVWMPYGAQYVDEGTYGAATPYQYVYTARLGWAWCAAPWLWGWGAYPYFGALGPYRFGWYRGLYRSGYGWGRYRGGYPSGGYRGGYSGGGYTRGGGAYHATRPLGGGNVMRGSVPPSSGGRFQGARGTYRAAPARPGSFGGGGRVASNGSRSGSPHAVTGSRGGGHRGR
jgi:hypothetical protein